MRILFTTDFKTSPSTQINQPNLERLRELGVEFDVHNRAYEKYDVVIFMGYDPDIAGVRKVNRNAKVGVMDVRPNDLQKVLGADFILANGLEMKEFCQRWCSNIFVYYIYPHLALPPRLHAPGEKVVIGYHGNRVHLETMKPRVWKAIRALSRDRAIEFRAIYNIKTLGKTSLEHLDCEHLEVKHIQWAEDAVERHFGDVDIGIAPDLLPMRNIVKAKKVMECDPKRTNEDDSDFLLRFKATSNPGRILVFAQLGIPVVADLYPSALDIIKDGHSGFVAASDGSWYRALKRLSSSHRLRQTLGTNLRADFLRFYAVDQINNRLIQFLYDLAKNEPLPVELVPGLGDWTPPGPPLECCKLSSPSNVGKSRWLTGRGIEKW